MSTFIPGLAGVVAAETKLSKPNGRQGQLTIAGYAVEELALNATFEEATYLLWHGRRPDATELGAFCAQLASQRALPAIALGVLQAAAQDKLGAMDALRMAAGTLNLAAGENLAMVLVARFPTIVAAYWRLRQGQTPVAPDPELGHAANYLYMLTGERPSEAKARGLEIYLNTVIDHGLNASTFTARTIISTDSDMVSAIVGAVGALKGPKHGGAPGPALETVFAIGKPDNAEPHLREKLERGERLMGFGHRVYKVRDPRAVVLSQAAERLFEQDGDMSLYVLAKCVEETAVRLLAEYKPGRDLQTNVEFYTALLLHGVGLDTDLFTPTFAIGRVPGWIAHCYEQQRTGRLIRPTARYVGETNRQWL